MKMKNNQVTIIIPNYNGIHYLNECLSSIYYDIKEDYKKTTPVIVIDNASTDGSTKNLNTDFPELKLIKLSQNTGFCHAVNTGIKESDTEFVILLNNDTTIRPGFIRNLVNTISKENHIFSVSAKMLNMKNPTLIDNAGDFYNALGWAFSRGKGKKSINYNKETAIFSACGGASIYRRQIIKELGYFDEAHFAYLEDVDLGYAARLHGYKNLFCPIAEVLHAGSATSGSRYNQWKTDLASRNNIYLIIKNMPIPILILNLPFLLIGCLIKFIFFSFKGMSFQYLHGIAKGIKLSLTATGRSRKLRFKIKNLKHYLIIQLELWINILRMLS